jgi:signal transduction histidine kinase
VFEDFFSTKGREGTGLGLLVAQKVVEEHGGRITFRSEEGQGTIFKAEFPTHI